MQTTSKTPKKSHQTKQPQPTSSPNTPQNQSCQISPHLQNQIEMAELGRKARSALLQSGRFKWDEQFREEIHVQILETDFQWVRVMVHYGNYRVDVLVIYVDVDQRVFQEGDYKSGAFGVVRFVDFKRTKYAVKGIKFSYNQGDINTLAAYKEYFLGCIADILEIGPKIFPLFGYDILLTKNMAFFCMEECQQIKLQSPQLVESELLSNLKLMHSIQFVHNDIKPENMGYSRQLQKHIFLDFGLSKLIQQPPGEKTRTKFLGTLHYCSDEMKKCYLLQIASYVDLYGNDFCCLNKTTKKFQYLLEMQNFFQGKQIKKEDTCQQITFLEVIQILRLKYYIQTENIKRTQEILSALVRKKNKRIIHQIFSNFLIPRTISENESIKQRLNIIKKEVFSEKFQIEKLDCMLCQIFSQEKRVISVEKIIPISQILHSKPELFDQYLVKPDLMLKLLHFFQPFTKNLYIVEKKYEIKRAIIEKIYQMKSTEITGPVFFYEKVRFVLVYFYEKLKGLKNLKAMLSLRLLFILMQQWNFVKKLQNQIVEMIEEPFLKVLKIVQFALFKRSFQRFQEMIQQEPAIDGTLDKLNLSQFKASKLLQIIKPSRLKNIPNDSYEKNRQTLNAIYKISQECANFYQNQSISNIYFMYKNICQSYNSTFSQKFANGSPIDTFYSISWSFITIEVDSCINYEQKIFWPIKIQYFSYLQKQKPSNQLEVLLENQLIILEGRSLSLNHYVEYMQLFHPDKKILYYWLRKFRKIFKSQSSVSKEQIIFSLYCVSEFLQFVLRNQLQANQDNKISKQQKSIMINGLEEAFSEFIAKQQIKQIIENFKSIKIKVGIARVKFDFEKGKTLEELRPQIETLVNMFQLFPDHGLRLSNGFFTIFNYLSKFLCQPGSNYLKDTLVYVTEQYIERKQYHMFQGLSQMPQHYVRINNEKGREDRNLKVILELIDYYKNKKNQIQMCSLSIKIFYNLVNFFCTTLPIQKLVSIYLQLRFSKKQYLCGYYAYLIFSIFLRIRMQINEPDQLRQVIKTTLCLANIPPMCFIKSKLEIVRLYRQLVAFKSRRKAFICRRLEVRNTISSNRIQAFMGELRNKVDKIFQARNRNEQVILKLEEKIQKFHKD